MSAIPLPVVSYQISPQSQGKIDVAPQLSFYYPQNISPDNSDHFKLIPAKFNSGGSEVAESEKITEASDEVILEKLAGNQNSNTNIRNEEIPAKTKQLLEENYWNVYKKSREFDGEIYRKELQSHEKMGAPETKKRKSGDEEVFKKESSLKLGTLEHCSVLSSMINNSRDQEKITIPKFSENPGNCQLEITKNSPIFPSIEDNTKLEERKILTVKTFGERIFFETLYKIC